MAKNYYLKLTSALVISGAICRAGSLVEVSEAEAKNFLHRGKAVLATEADGITVAQDDPNDQGEADLAKMNKAQLLEFAQDNGIEVSDGMTKAQLLEAIENASEKVGE